MQSSRLWSLPLALAGILSCGMALYHSVLPYHMGWRQGLDGVPDSIVWALHGAYTWLDPLPLPGSLAWLKLVIGLFPAVVVALHWIPLVLYRRHPAQG